jgi:hypothetical protein
VRRHVDSSSENPAAVVLAVSNDCRAASLQPARYNSPAVTKLSSSDLGAALLSCCSRGSITARRRYAAAGPSNSVLFSWLLVLLLSVTCLVPAMPAVLLLPVGSRASSRG